MIAEWITAVATALTTLSVLIIWRQVRADHERSRREKALELMEFWTTHTDYMSPFFVFGRQIVQSLTREQCELLFQREPFAVDRKIEHLVDAFRADFAHRLRTATTRSRANASKDDNEKEILLTKTESAALRMIAITFLNMLEVVATAWRHNIADRGILEEEFADIISPRTNRFALDTFRAVTGIYPSISMMEHQLQQRKRVTSGKPAILP